MYMYIYYANNTFWYLLLLVHCTCESSPHVYIHMHGHGHALYAHIQQHTFFLTHVDLFSNNYADIATSEIEVLY